MYDYDKAERYIRRNLLLFSGLLLVFNIALFVLMSTFYMPDAVSGAVFILTVLAVADFMFILFVLFISHLIKRIF